MSELLGLTNTAFKTVTAGANNGWGSEATIGTAAGAFKAMTFHFGGASSTSKAYLARLKVGSTVVGHYIFYNARNNRAESFSVRVPYGGSASDAIKMDAAVNDTVTRNFVAAVSLHNTAEVKDVPANTMTSYGHTTADSGGLAVEAHTSTPDTYGNSVTFSSSMAHAVDYVVVSGAHQSALTNTPTRYVLALLVDDVLRLELPFTCEIQRDTLVPALMGIPVDRTLFPASSSLKCQLKCDNADASDRVSDFVINTYVIDSAAGGSGGILINPGTTGGAGA